MLLLLNLIRNGFSLKRSTSRAHFFVVAELHFQCCLKYLGRNFWFRWFPLLVLLLKELQLIRMRSAHAGSSDHHAVWAKCLAPTDPSLANCCSKQAIRAIIPRQRNPCGRLVPTACPMLWTDVKGPSACC